MEWLRALNCSFLSINVRVDVETNLETHRKFWISLYLIFGDVCKNWYYVFLAIVLCVRLPRRNLECFSSKHEVALESEMWKNNWNSRFFRFRFLNFFSGFWISCQLFIQKFNFDKTFLLRDIWIFFAKIWRYFWIFQPRNL